ncbi:hypothetical protein [Evansella cellulosilytica]|uniref:Lipoprotein n=1 Tax=Evansella cellulosilytica (strain ATCC 21833 / DSM 2522 / FERM P-1141 / JCM 9156 / N-4) TaxID=649639 RepID=E6TUV8_EVAC2|nr:hypothetical protein [Evansella cellulosilytica]ADU32110.1 hypothetical protein Bcell_3871 [Evansella cellulosilytica DSM 2522]
MIRMGLIFAAFFILIGCNNASETEVDNSIIEVEEKLQEELGAVIIPKYSDLGISYAYTYSDFNGDEDSTHAYVQYSDVVGEAFSDDVIAEWEENLIVETNNIYGPYEGEPIVFLQFTNEINDEVALNNSDQNTGEMIVDSHHVTYVINEAVGFYIYSFDTDHGSYTLGYDMEFFTFEETEEHIEDFISQIDEVE